MLVEVLDGALGTMAPESLGRCWLPLALGQPVGSALRHVDIPPVWASTIRPHPACRMATSALRGIPSSAEMLRQPDSVAVSWADGQLTRLGSWMHWPTGYTSCAART